MRTYADEQDLSPWTWRSARAVADDLLAVARERRAPTGRNGPLVVAVDGSSAGGKSTVAGRLAAATRGGVVVHTDDIAWNHGFFDWDALLVDGVLAPAARSEAVEFRPPAWVEGGRKGAIQVSAGSSVLFVEGVGSSRTSLAPWLDATVWVQSDAEEAYRRGIDRDIVLGRTRDEAVAFWHQWMVHEVAFLAADRPWERADVVLCGTPPEEVEGLLVSRACATPAEPAKRRS